MSDIERYHHYESIVSVVDEAIQAIKSLPINKCYDADYLEKTFIPSVGLNNEALNEQPAELSQYFGKGLHLWQYPNQLSHYLVWLSHNARSIKSYMEIGCRWGGTFILINEWLKKIGAELEYSIAVDPIEPTPFIRHYIELSDTPVVYINKFSSDPEFLSYMSHSRPEIVFIDGDHTMRGVMIDHLSARKTAKIIVHHDIVSSICPDTALFWSYAKLAEDNFEFAEFVQQYDSVNGSFLGIGVMKRKL